MSKIVVVPTNAKMTYTVSKDGYETIKGDVVVLGNTSIDVVLSSNTATITINPTPSDAIVTLTADGYTQVGNSISVDPGTSVNYSVQGPQEVEVYAWTSQDDPNVTIYTKKYQLNVLDNVYQSIYDNQIEHIDGLDISTTSGVFWLDLNDSIIDDASTSQINIYGYVEK